MMKLINPLMSVHDQCDEIGVSTVISLAHMVYTNILSIHEGWSAKPVVYQKLFPPLNVC